MTYMTGDIPVIWRHFLLDISHIFYAKRVVTMCSLVMSLFSRDYIKTEIDYYN